MNNKSIIVTGGAVGLGKSIVQKLASHSTNFVHFTYCNSSHDASKLESDFKNVKGHFCDFKSKRSVLEFSDKILELNPDGLVNNAWTGIHQKHFHKSDVEDAKVYFEENVFSTLLIAQNVIKLFRKKKGGRLVTILTSYLKGPVPIGLSNYVSSKAYLETASKAWASENARFRIISNCISPSMMATKFVSNLDERIIQNVKDMMPTGELVKPKDVAEVVEFLMREKTSINGANILVTGGTVVI